MHSAVNCMRNVLGLRSWDSALEDTTPASPHSGTRERGRGCDERRPLEGHHSPRSAMKADAESAARMAEAFLQFPGISLHDPLAGRHGATAPAKRPAVSFAGDVEGSRLERCGGDNATELPIWPGDAAASMRAQVHAEETVRGGNGIEAPVTAGLAKCIEQTDLCRGDSQAVSPPCTCLLRKECNYTLDSLAIV